jgi:Leucine-rich repeat (LRR) protein
MLPLSACIYILFLGWWVVGDDTTWGPPPTVPEPDLTGPFTDCPIHCSCELRTSPLSGSRKHTMDCRAAGFTHAPTFINTTLNTEVLVLSSNPLHSDQIVGLDALVNLTELDLSGNNIYSLQNLQIDVEGLLYLLLDHNELDYLDQQTFRGSPNLIFLSLVANKIEIMHAQAFNGLRNLQTLDLTGNRIFEINMEWFRTLHELRVLHLHDNNIHTLHKGGFKFLRSLKTLDLSNNHIKHIYPDAFFGLIDLHQLELQTNDMDNIPEKVFDVFRSLRLLDLSENFFARLETGSIQDIKVSHLLLTRLQHLLLIDSGAISSMPELLQLDLSQNPHLMSIDGLAFSKLPNLEILKLHQTNLTVIDERLITSLPALKHFSFYSNPFHCDCNIKWLVTEMHQHGRNLTLDEPEVHDGHIDFACASPPSLSGVHLMDSKLLKLPGSCPPRILPLFPGEYNTALGETVLLDCRATGVPVPQTDWLLPAEHHGLAPGEVIIVRSGGSSPRPHVQVSKSGSLLVDYVQAVDQGQYTCLASNTEGRDERSAHINVTNIRANVIVMRVTAHAITVTWRSSRYAHDYQILYRASGRLNATYRVVDIKPYMRSYTVSELEAETAYEFCIAVQHDSRSVRINCTQVRTRTPDFLTRSIFNSRDYIIGGSIAGFIIVAIAVCALAHVVRRYNKRRRQQEELYTDNLSQLFLASMDSMSDTTPITYENRAAEMFDDDDIDEIRSTASMASTSNSSIR